MLPDKSQARRSPRLHRPRESCECASPFYSPVHIRSTPCWARKFPGDFFRFDSLVSSLRPPSRSGYCPAFVAAKLLTQLESLHLSRRSVRQFRNEVITTRLFESRQRRFAKRAYVSFRRI